MKRFYETVAIGEEGAGFRVLLDDRPVRTPSGAAQVLPTRALAEALAGEWRRQGERIDPRSFPLRDLADYAIDHVRPERASLIAGLVAYAKTDTLCYRADPDDPLYQRQQQLWEPLVAACETAHGLRLERVSGVMPREQPQESLERLRAVLADMDDFRLAAARTLASLAAALTVALAALEDEADTTALFLAANLEEEWQAEKWGWDDLAEDDRNARLEAFALAARFARLARAVPVA